MNTKKALEELDGMAAQFIGHEKTNVFAEIADVIRALEKYALATEPEVAGDYAHDPTGRGRKLYRECVEVRPILYSRTREILDENGKVLTIGMRVGCRKKGQPRSLSIRGLTLTAYEHGAEEPYITSGGRFALAIMDHQPEMDRWIADHVSA